MMSIYKGKRPGTYRIVLYYGQRKPFDAVIEATREEAEAYHARKRLELNVLRERQSPCQTATSFVDFCVTHYIPYAARTLKRSTQRNRSYQIELLIEHFGPKRLDRFTVLDIVQFQTVRQSAGIGNVKINDDVKVLLTILNYGASLGIPVTVPPRAARGRPGWKPLPERVVQGKTRYWTEDEVKALYNAIEEECPHLLGITVTMINCGLRKGEALALEWSCVDLDRDELKIWPNEEWQPKNGKPREVAIGDAVRPWLTEPRQHPRWVFPTLPSARKPEGDRYVAWPQNQWDRARKRSRVGGSPHVCRHTFASHFLAKKPDLVLLAQVMGHSHTKVTRLYTHFLPGYLDEARNVVHLPAPRLTAVPGPTLDVHGSPMFRVSKAGGRP
jgi:integrase